MSQPGSTTLFCAANSDCPHGQRCYEGLCCSGSSCGSMGTTRNDARVSPTGPGVDAWVPPVIPEAGSPPPPPPPPKPDAMVAAGCSATSQCSGNNVCVSGSCVGPTWSNVGQPYMDSYCDGCHGFMGSQSGVASDQYRIKSYIQDGSMPPSGYPAASSDENTALFRWFAAGLPN